MELLKIAKIVNKRHFDVFRITKVLESHGLLDDQCNSTFMFRGHTYPTMTLSEIDTEAIIYMLTPYRELESKSSNNNNRSPVKRLYSLKWWLSQLRTINSEPTPHLKSFGYVPRLDVRMFKLIKENIKKELC